MSGIVDLTIYEGEEYDKKLFELFDGIIVKREPRKWKSKALEYEKAKLERRKQNERNSTKRNIKKRFR